MQFRLQVVWNPFVESIARAEAVAPCLILTA